MSVITGLTMAELTELVSKANLSTWPSEQLAEVEAFVWADHLRHPTEASRNAWALLNKELIRRAALPQRPLDERETVLRERAARGEAWESTTDEDVALLIEEIDRLRGALREWLSYTDNWKTADGRRVMVPIAQIVELLEGK